MEVKLIFVILGLVMHHQVALEALLIPLQDLREPMVDRLQQGITAAWEEVKAKLIVALSRPEAVVEVQEATAVLAAKVGMKLPPVVQVVEAEEAVVEVEVETLLSGVELVEEV